MSSGRHAPPSPPRENVEDDAEITGRCEYITLKCHEKSILSYERVYWLTRECNKQKWCKRAMRAPEPNGVKPFVLFCFVFYSEFHFFFLYVLKKN